ncbi:MAG: hypothetical protein U0936_25195 [Planctomycetaceae bacterium]
MKTSVFRGLGLMGLLLLTNSTTRANDLVDFLNALNGNSNHRNAPPAIQPVGHHDHEGRGMHGSGYRGHEMTGRDVYKRNMQVADRDMHYLGYSQNQGSYGRHGHGDMEQNRVNLRDESYGRSGRSYYSGRSGARISFSVSSNPAPVYGQPIYFPSQDTAQPLPPVQELPPVQSYPVIPGNQVVPGYQTAPVFPHQIGEIVDCHVPLATSVRVEDECKIAPNAVPVVVAVRDPKMCTHDVMERVVFVQVFVPPCPPRSMEISPCHTRVKMDFGMYEVDIKSKDGLIVVDYDN